MPLLPAAGYTIPTSPTIEPSPTSLTPYQEIRAPAEAFGAATAQALSGLGTSFEKASANLEAMNSFHDQVVVDEQKNFYDDFVNKKLYGDPNTPGDVGYMGLQGKNALEAREGVRKDLDNIRMAQRSKLTNTHQLVMFDQETSRLRNIALGAVGRHYDEQYNRHAAETAESGVKLALNGGSVAANNNDFGAFKVHLGNALSGYEIAEKLNGKDPQTIELGRTNIVKAFTSDWADKAILRNSQEGRAFVIDHKNELGDKYDQLLHKAETAAHEYDVNELANGRPPTMSQPNLVRGGAVQSHLNYGATGALGDPNQPGWQQENIVPAKAPSGATFQVHKSAKSDVEAFLKELEDKGYKINPTESGGYAKRNITGGNTLSEHAYGTAFDINPSRNPYSAEGKRVTDLPPDISEIAGRHNLEWGGNWKSPVDTMHFQWRPPGTIGGGTPPVIPTTAGTDVGTVDNNLGGIRKTGVNADKAHGGFQTFATPEAGVQAIAQNLTRYSAGGVVTATNPTGAPLNTIRGIVSTWAPPGENKTDELIARAVKHTGFAPDQKLDLSQPDVMQKMVEAVVLNEQGKLTPENKQTIMRGLTSKPVDTVVPTVDQLPKVSNMPILPPLEPNELPDGQVPGLQQRLEAAAKVLPPNAPPKLWNDTVRKIRQEENAKYTANLHVERMKDIAQKRADQEIGDDYYKRVTPGSANRPTEEEVLSDTRISQEKRKDIIGIMRSMEKPDPHPSIAANEMIEANKRLGLEDGDPNKITQESQLDDLYNNKKITWDMKTALSNKLKTLNDATTANINKHTTQLLKDAERTIFPLKHLKGDAGVMSDPPGPMRERAYQFFVESTVKDWVKAGKNPMELFDPGPPEKPNPNYLGRQSILDYYGKGARGYGSLPANNEIPDPAKHEFKSGAEVAAAYKAGRFGPWGSPEAKASAAQYLIATGLGRLPDAPAAGTEVPMR